VPSESLRPSQSVIEVCTLDRLSPSADSRLVSDSAPVLWTTSDSSPSSSMVSV